MASVFPQVEAIFVFWHGASYWARSSRRDKAGWPVSPGTWVTDRWGFYVNSDGALTPVLPSPSFPVPTFILAAWFAFCCCEPFHSQSNLGGTSWYPLTAHSPWWKEVRPELKPENRSLELKKRPRENAKETLHGSHSAPFYSAQTTGTGPCHSNRLSLKCPPQHCSLDSLMEPPSDWRSLFPNDSIPVKLITLSSTLLCPFPGTPLPFSESFLLFLLYWWREAIVTLAEEAATALGSGAAGKHLTVSPPAALWEVVFSLIKTTNGTAWCSGFCPILPYCGFSEAS